MIKVDNAIILAAGVGSRMQPLTAVMPKSLITVKGDRLIERLIQQLTESGVPEIEIVTGYMAEKFEYLGKKYGVRLLYNPEYLTRNTWYSLYTAKDYMKNSYICSADYYYFDNPFRGWETHAYCETVAPGTDGAVRGVTSDSSGLIVRTSVPAENEQWMMFGHSFFDEEFSCKYRNVLKETCLHPEKYECYWEQLYSENIGELKLYEKRIDFTHLAELDTLAELEAFDPKWKKNNLWADELKL